MDHIPALEDLEPVFEHLQQAEFVTAGGFKAVFRATLAGRQEALKVVLLPPEDEEGSREQIIARVMREIEALNRCETPYLVKLGSLEPITVAISGHDYLAYSEEFLPGQSVNGLIAQGTRPPFEAILSLARCIMEALTEIERIGHMASLEGTKLLQSI